ncbi:MAG TPA: Gfo/Idh/MocA family oxidoreductase [Candidatus Paceibacterota bacterium]|nr:Gfo/Idh/MocA family oxidoreductase [Candidatus Paceibacterota bacterium]
MNRRSFLRLTGVIGASSLSPALLLRAASSPPGNKIVVGIMGLGRGQDLMKAILGCPEAEIGYLCDVDSNRLAAASNVLSKAGRPNVKAVKDFRKILDDSAVDALIIATGNYWHAPATIMACAAGKHVYVEKPGSHNPREGELMVLAAQKHRRVVQQGTQRRSFPVIQEGIGRLRSGAIGQVKFARSWYTNSRPSIGRGKVVPVPASLDYALWQGPVPARPYVDNLVHYNWHWRWHWGNGELGNNGIHYLDLARWGLGVEYPRSITYNGGRYHFDDDQETPDTGVVTFDFGSCGVSWEHSSCHPRKPESFPLVNFYGTDGMLSMEGNGYKIFDLNGKMTSQASGPGGDQVHMADFLDSIRQDRKPSATIEEGQKSTLLCHLGNIAYRVGHVVHFNPEQRQIEHDAKARKLWSREYRKGWEPRV